jgi:hypothetical protein
MARISFVGRPVATGRSIEEVFSIMVSAAP